MCVCGERFSWNNIQPIPDAVLEEILNKNSKAIQMGNEVCDHHGLEEERKPTTIDEIDYWEADVI
jgi:hypothetical protein